MAFSATVKAGSLRGTGAERMRLLFLGDHFADFGLDPFQIGFPTTTLDHFVVLLTHDDSPDIFYFLGLQHKPYYSTVLHVCKSLSTKKRDVPPDIPDFFTSQDINPKSQPRFRTEWQP
jgi:hypothetical protein